MTMLARVALLDLRTIAPYRRQVILTPLLIMAVLFNRPEVIVPALVMLSAPTTAGYPFLVSDRADLETLYGVLPLTRRSLVLGHYAWGLATFVVTAGVGTPVALLLARQQDIPFGGQKLAAVAALSWAAFVLNTSIQFPLFVRFGYTRAGMLGTALPIALVAVAAARTHTDLTPSPTWTIPLAVGGVALFGVSAAVAMVVDPRRVRRGTTRESTGT